MGDRFKPELVIGMGQNMHPTGVDPQISSGEFQNEYSAAITDATRNLMKLRDNWLNPTEWIDRVPEVVDGYPDRIIPKKGHEDDLKKRTLTNLYNERPAWLDNAHRELDKAVAAAYGWPAELDNDEILARLLELNLKQAANENKDG